MASNLWPTGVRLLDPADILALTRAVATATAVAGPATLASGAITGGDFVVLISSNAAPGTQTTRAASQMYADDPTAAPGQSYILRICNAGAGTFTLAGGVGVTISGTATVATTTFRDFVVAYSGVFGSPVVTITNVGTGTYS
jgi:hypothetical protein